ncbi:MAG: 4Fe-4S binding protein [Candidatus Pacebacteria bacterium]|nr:4Fe-4S binding protein [Candidatus Paceibacterota bacterium]MDR3583470.1 4Fe-4S binding protein [Candidatus Paceibacterota bacterium]
MEHGAVIKHDLKKGPKTGAWRYMHPEVDKSKCIGCSTCVPFCPEASIEMKDKKAEIDYDYCKGCGVCAEVCPVKAILMKKK